MDTFRSPKSHHHSRMEVRWEVHFFTDSGHMEGETVNISPEGVMVSCKELPPLEDKFRLVIRPPDHYPLDVTGRVVWTTICNPVSGAESIGVDIQFMSIGEKDKTFLQGLVGGQFDKEVNTIGRDLTARPEVDIKREVGPAEAPQIAEISLPVFYTNGGKVVQAMGSRFSTKGCHIYTRLAPPKGSVFSLQVKNPRTGKSIQVDSSVVQCKRCLIKNHWGMILRFMNLSGSEREEIRQILEEASVAPLPQKEPKYIKSRIGQALLKHFGKKRTVH
ncbi:MAG: PilZ domain-containing protein [Deltaproteobacteria bacterium]|nr:PilZ domain-containing protein [Deltaproteobacteria bacterium]